MDQFARQDVPDDALKRVATFAELASFPEGGTVIREGAYANDFFAIEDGTAKVEKDGEKLYCSRKSSRERAAPRKAYA